MKNKKKKIIRYKIGVFVSLSRLKQINQINRISHTSLATVKGEKDTRQINAYYVTGFTDGEGCFLINIAKRDKYKIGWQIQLSFQIGLHAKDKALLEKIQNYFKVGSISKHGPCVLHYRVQSTKDLAIIINHFDQYPLLTQKFADYKLF